MKNKWMYNCISFSFVFAVLFTIVLSAVMGAESSEDIASEENFKTILRKYTSDHILQINVDDYENNAKWSAFALVGEAIDNRHSISAELWYVNEEYAEMLYKGFFYPEIGSWTVNSQKIVDITEVYTTAGVSHLWIVENDKPVKLGGGFESMSHKGGNDFYIHPSAYDACIDGTGHTWKRYYLYWDGKQFKEYGGIKITEQQLLELDGAKEFVDGIKGKGYYISDIFYRENGIININYHSEYDNINATLQIQGRSVELILCNDWGEDNLEKSSYGGIYKAANFESIAVYPLKFLFDATASESTTDILSKDSREQDIADYIENLSLGCVVPINDFPTVDKMDVEWLIQRFHVFAEQDMGENCVSLKSIEREVQKTVNPSYTFPENYDYSAIKVGAIGGGMKWILNKRAFEWYPTGGNDIEYRTINRSVRRVGDYICFNATDLLFVYNDRYEPTSANIYCEGRRIGIINIPGGTMDEIWNEDRWIYTYITDVNTLPQHQYILQSNEEGSYYLFSKRLLSPSDNQEILLPQALMAIPTSSTVLVDGEKVAFDAYNIDGNNYFKLRDLAYVLNGTEKQFGVGWDGEKNAINLVIGKAYTEVGGEMASKGSGSKIPAATNAKIHLDGKEIELTAYNIDGNNYFKLRDIGEAFDFNVRWDSKNNAIIINTAEGYTLDE